MLRNGAHFVRFIAAVSLLMPLFTGAVASAETLASHSPVPQSLLLKFLADNATFTLVDARSTEEFAASHITGAINLPLFLLEGVAILAEVFIFAVVLLR